MVKVHYPLTDLTYYPSRRPQPRPDANHNNYCAIVPARIGYTSVTQHIKYQLFHDVMRQHLYLIKSTFPVECTGLKTEWTSTMETTTEFPVHPGTVVDISCSNPSALKQGSSEVTCRGITGTDFTFVVEPNCSDLPGMF